MTVKDTIKSMIITCPRLFPTKLSVYDHLFLTIGNGYRWENGELISEDHEENCSIEDGLEELFNNDFQYDVLKICLDGTTNSEVIINYIKRKNKEEFKSWKESNYRHILIENDEEYPNNYPCVLVEKYVENYYGEEDNVYYTFIYLNDFMD